MKANYDITIIGGGIIGLFSAYLASKKYKEANILVLDQNFKATGATFYSIALDIPYGETKEKREFSRVSRKYFSELDKLTSYKRQQIPFIGVTHQDNFKHLSNNFINKVECQKKNINEVNLGKDEIAFAEMDAWQSLPSEYLESLKNIIKTRDNVTLSYGIKVLGIDKSNDLFTIKTSRGVNIYSKNIINATGPWLLDDIWKGEVQQLKVRTKKIISYHLPFKFKTGIFLFDHDAFITPKLDSDTESIYSFRANEYDVVPRIGDITITEKNNKKAIELFQQYFPNTLNTNSFNMFEGRCFCDTYAESPIAQEISQGYIIAGAGSGSGFRLAPGIAEKAVSFITL